MAFARPSLTVYLVDPPKPHYHPGSTISGQVNLVTLHSEAIRTIEITLSGRCKVKIRKHDHYTTRTYRSRGYYFLETKTLYEGNGYTHKPGTYSWPFTFSIPMKATVHCELSVPTSRPKHQLNSIGILERNETTGPVNDMFAMQSPWRGSNELRPHTLPCSFTFSHSGMQTASDAKVDYVLLAKLTRPSSSILFLAKDIEISRDILLGMAVGQRDGSTFLEAPLVQGHEECIIKFPASPLLSIPSPTSTKSLFRDKIRSLVHMSSDLQISVKIVVSIPTVIMPGIEPLILLQIPQVARSEECTWSSDPPPIIQLRSYKVYVIITTALRDNSASAIAQSVVANRKEILTERKDLDVELLNLGDERQQEGRMNLSLKPSGFSSLDGFKLNPATFPPSFSTYNIFRGYKLGVELKFCCMGKNASLVKEVDLEILPYRRAKVSDDVQEHQPPAFEENSRDEKKSKDENGRPTLQEPNEAKDGEQLPAYEP